MFVVADVLPLRDVLLDLGMRSTMWVSASILRE